jgi:hypothetical protein
MRATWRALASWPYPPGRRMTGDRIRSGWDAALGLLEEEIARLKGSDVVLGVVVSDDQVGFSGQLKAGGRTRFQHRGVEVSFDTTGRGRLVFHTDAYDDVTANVRAIGLGLEALRAVDRHGITSSAEQYAGFAMLPPGGPDPARGRQLVEAAGGMRQAERRHHPDAGGEQRDFVDIQAYKASLAPAARA